MARVYALRRSTDRAARLRAAAAMLREEIAKSDELIREDRAFFAAWEMAQGMAKLALLQPAGGKPPKRKGGGPKGEAVRRVPRRAVSRRRVESVGLNKALCNAVSAMLPFSISTTQSCEPPAASRKNPPTGVASGVQRSAPSWAITIAPPRPASAPPGRRARRSGSVGGASSCRPPCRRAVRRAARDQPVGRKRRLADLLAGP